LDFDTTKQTDMFTQNPVDKAVACKNASSAAKKCRRKPRKIVQVHVFGEFEKTDIKGSTLRKLTAGVTMPTKTLLQDNHGGMLTLSVENGKDIHDGPRSLYAQVHKIYQENTFQGIIDKSEEDAKSGACTDKINKGRLYLTKFHYAKFIHRGCVHYAELTDKKMSVSSTPDEIYTQIRRVFSPLTAAVGHHKRTDATFMDHIKYSHEEPEEGL
jgi:hypothetical protein